MSGESQLSDVQKLLLLALWDLSQFKFKGAKVPKTEVRNRVSKAKSPDLNALLEPLGLVAADGREERKECVCLTPAGEAALSAALADAGFEFVTNTGANTVNALLHWIRVKGSATVPATVPAAAQIESYEAFKAEALTSLEQLNSDFQLNGLVGIYRLRRKLGNSVSRADFNEWLMDMHRQSMITLISGDMPDLTPDIAEDSLINKLGTVYYYIQIT